MNKEELAANAKWFSVEKRCSWSTITTRELADILGVSHQNVANWHLREKLPPPEPRRKGGGNKNRWKISIIKNWLYDTPEDETHWEFINNHMYKGFESIEQAIETAELHWRAFEIEKPN